MEDETVSRRGRATGWLLALTCVLVGFGFAAGVLAYGPKRLVFCQDADALSDVYRWAAEPTIGIVHIDGGAGYYPSCYAPSQFAWWLSLAAVVGGLLAAGYIVVRRRYRSVSTV